MKIGSMNANKITGKDVALNNFGVEKMVEKGIDLTENVWEGWTIQDFINEMKPQLDRIMEGGSFMKKIETKEELVKWCNDNQPYYKKTIPKLIEYFMNEYNIGK